MPPLFGLDDFDNCDLEPSGYCVADFQLFSQNQSDLMKIIQDYSLDTNKHFDHTQIHRGVCLETCQIKHSYKSNKTTDLRYTLEACVNQSAWKGYGLQAKMKTLHYCEHNDRSIQLDAYDIAVAVVYVILIIFITVGTLYDLYQSRNEGKKDNEYLMAFSLKRNWAKLVAPAGLGPDPRLNRLKIINGLRAMTMVCVIFSHTALMLAASYVANPLYIEEAYDDFTKQILFNGNLVVHTFFVMSSFLLAYNLQIYSEKHKLSWSQVPKAIILRWIRLTPPFALVLATISSWMRHFGSGPLWRLVVLSETQACRQYWWTNVLYFNNYYFQLCFPISWYLSADFQLFIVGITLLVAVQTTRRRVIALSLLFVLSLIITASHTYFEDLNAVIIQSPETIQTLFLYEKTFLHVNIRGHTNLSTYSLGLAAGLLTHYWQNNNFDATKYKKYRWLIWIQFPLAVALILSGMIFFVYPHPPTPLRVLYATFFKPLFQIMVLSFMVMSVFKFESVYRPIVEWRGWTWVGRVSYSAFLLHPLYQRGYVGAQRAPLHLSDYHVLIVLGASVLMSLLSGAILWLTVEAPVAALTKILFKTGGNK